MGRRNSCVRTESSDLGVPGGPVGSDSRLWRFHHSQDVKEGAWCEKGEKWASAEAVARMNGEGSGEGTERSSIQTTPSVETTVP